MPYPTLGSNSKLHDGIVKFGIQFKHKTFGAIDLNGQYPRIKPQFQREDLEQDVEDGLVRKVLVWAEQHFDTSQRKPYFHSLATNAVRLHCYNEPWSRLGSKELDLGIKHIFWTWKLDDLLDREAAEMGIGQNLIFAETQKLIQIMKTLNGGSNEIETCCDLFRPYCTSLVALMELYTELFQNYYEFQPPFIFFTQRYYEACNFISIHSNAEMLSEDMFQYWRNLSNYSDGVAAIIASIRGINITQDMLTSPRVIRILDISNCYPALANDIFGIRMDMMNGSKDNVFIYKFSQKSTPFEVAVKEVCQKLEELVFEYKLLREEILEGARQSKDLNLEKFLSVLDCVMDGHNRIYKNNTRYETYAMSMTLEWRE